ncbi:hypothetical protein ACJX0J_006013, partial [Zea mays]
MSFLYGMEGIDLNLVKSGQELGGNDRVPHDVVWIATIHNSLFDLTSNTICPRIEGTSTSDYRAQYITQQHDWIAAKNMACHHMYANTLFFDTKERERERVPMYMHC